MMSKREKFNLSVSDTERGNNFGAILKRIKSTSDVLSGKKTDKPIEAREALIELASTSEGRQILGAMGVDSEALKKTLGSDIARLRESPAWENELQDIKDDAGASRMGDDEFLKYVSEGELPARYRSPYPVPTDSASVSRLSADYGDNLGTTPIMERVANRKDYAQNKVGKIDDYVVKGAALLGVPGANRALEQARNGVPLEPWRDASVRSALSGAANFGAEALAFVPVGKVAGGVAKGAQMAGGALARLGAKAYNLIRPAAAGAEAGALSGAGSFLASPTKSDEVSGARRYVVDPAFSVGGGAALGGAAGGIAGRLTGAGAKAAQAATAKERQAVLHSAAQSDKLTKTAKPMDRAAFEDTPYYIAREAESIPTPPRTRIAKGGDYDSYLSASGLADPANLSDYAANAASARAKTAEAVKGTGLPESPEQLTGLLRDNYEADIFEASRRMPKSERKKVKRVDRILTDNNLYVTPENERAVFEKIEAYKVPESLIPATSDKADAMNTKAVPVFRDIYNRNRKLAYPDAEIIYDANGDPVRKISRRPESGKAGEEAGELARLDALFAEGSPASKELALQGMQRERFADPDIGNTHKLFLQSTSPYSGNRAAMAEGTAREVPPLLKRAAYAKAAPIAAANVTDLDNGANYRDFEKRYMQAFPGENSAVSDATAVAKKIPVIGGKIGTYPGSVEAYYEGGFQPE